MALTDAERTHMAREQLRLRDAPVESWTFQELERLKNLILEWDKKVDQTNAHDARRIRSIKQLWTNAFVAVRQLKAKSPLESPAQPATPKKPYRLGFNDRRFLRSLRIVSDDSEPDNDDEEADVNGNK